MSEVDAFLETLLRERNSPDGLYRMMAYHLGWVEQDGSMVPPARRGGYGGKKMRAILCSLACQAAGGEALRAVPAAAAVELVQNFSLIHDDIEDGDQDRRHRPTVWVVWGIPQAINAGSAMQALVNAAILHTDAPAETRWDIVSALTEAMVEMTEGQYLDIAFQDRADVSVAEYMDMANRKTGALMEAAAFTGARLATGGTDELAAWRQFGRSFGQAFQARDDLLGVTGNPKITGKPVGNDIRAHKKALPLVYALAHSSGSDREALLQTLRQYPVSDADVERVTAILEQCGALAAARAVVHEATKQALAALEATGAGGDAAKTIREMVLHAVGREQ